MTYFPHHHLGKNISIWFERARNTNTNTNTNTIRPERKTISDIQKSIRNVANSPWNYDRKPRLISPNTARNPAKRPERKTTSDIQKSIRNVANSPWNYDRKPRLISPNTARNPAKVKTGINYENTRFNQLKNMAGHYGVNAKRNIFVNSQAIDQACQTHYSNISYPSE